jgi:ketosteroid isomerase-like protein
MSDEFQLKQAWRSIELLMGGDLEAFLDLWSDDAVWHVGGDNKISGEYRGRDGIREGCRRFAEANGELKPLDVLADERHVVMIFRARGQRDGKSLDTINANFVIADDDGKWKSCWWVPSDQKLYDELWR